MGKWQHDLLAVTNPKSKEMYLRSTETFRTFLSAACTVACRISTLRLKFGSRPVIIFKLFFLNLLPDPDQCWRGRTANQVSENHLRNDHSYCTSDRIKSRKAVFCRYFQINSAVLAVAGQSYVDSPQSHLYLRVLT